MYLFLEAVFQSFAFYLTYFLLGMVCFLAFQDNAKVNVMLDLKHFVHSEN